MKVYLNQVTTIDGTSLNANLNTLNVKCISSFEITPPPLPKKQHRYPPQLNPQILKIPQNERQELYKLLNNCSNYNRENEQHSNSGLGLAKFPV
ncbi:hypothetical protein O1N16_003500 [Vibrio cholerae]|nr:hypothetical protein [Vibrio cholerae]